MADTLTRYNEKRHFTKTAEPRGQVKKKRAKKLHFVVQHHIASRDHYDFRLEWDGVLKSWAVPKGPSYDSHDKRLAVQVEDHPYDYRTFEGTIPKGEYGGGVVMLWDKGDWLPHGDVAESLRNGALKFTLEGERLKGKWALVRMKPREGGKNNNWLLVKERDEYENPTDIHEYATSVTSGRTMDEIGEGKKPAAKKKPVAKKKTAAKNKTAAPAAAAAAAPAPAPAPRKRAVKKTAAALADFDLTHPEKIMDKDAGITKGDVASYYLTVAERMMPYLQNRIISAVRCPNGIGKSCFYKKHPAVKTEGIATITVSSSEGKEEEYYYITDIHGLMFEVQMNTLEFHTWASRADRLEKPDIMVFDLDPDKGMDLPRIRQGVMDLKNMLDELSIASYLKTSGGKGYHVVIPFMPSRDWDVFYAFAQNIAKTMETSWPDRYTSNIRKNRRSNRIFIDWMRNGRGATSIAPYSVRAREGAPVSMPITWKELDTVAPDSVTMDDAIARLRKKDPWDGFFDNSQRLK